MRKKNQLRYRSFFMDILICGFDTLFVVYESKWSVFYLRFRLLVGQAKQSYIPV